MIIERQINLQKRGRSRTKLREGESGPQAPVGRVPRISRLMALAIRFDQLIREGVVVDQAELARVGRISRARMTQIMNLLSLAPDIQEQLLFLPVCDRDRRRIAEKHLRPVVAMPSWSKQRQMVLEHHLLERN